MAWIISFWLLVGGSWSYADSSSGNMSKSCAGHIKVCQDGSCSNKYVYMYAYQYAHIYNNEIRSENHNFNFSGVLGQPNQYTMQKTVSGHHVLYVGPQFILAIPWEDSRGIYISQGIAGPESDGWQLLCK